MSDPTYLGDGLYAHVDGVGRIVLTTGDHEPSRAENIIVLDKEVLDSLQRYIKKHGPNDD